MLCSTLEEEIPKHDLKHDNNDPLDSVNNLASPGLHPPNVGEGGADNIGFHEGLHAPDTSSLTTVISAAIWR